MAERVEVGLVVRRTDDVLREQHVGPVAVVLGRHAEHRGIGRRLAREVVGERAAVAGDGDEVRHPGTEAAAPGMSSRIARTAALAFSLSGSIEASGGSCATRVRTSSGCFATSASAFTAPPLLANRSTGPPTSWMIRCRSSACWSGSMGRRIVLRAPFGSARVVGDDRPVGEVARQRREAGGSHR